MDRVAAVAGVLAGAAAVYVTGGTQGNMSAAPATEPARPAVVARADDAACAAKADHAKAMAAEAKGQVAAMLPADPPKSLKALAFNSPDARPMTLADHAANRADESGRRGAPFAALEMPALDTLQKEKGGDRSEVVAVNVDRRRHEAKEVSVRDRHPVARLLSRQHARPV
jgi:hypothetical protein